MANITAIRCFLAALEEGSLSAAARQLGVSQPAVSQQIVQLEAELGQKLLVRNSKGVSPTAAGRILRRRGAEVLAVLARMEDELAALTGDAAGKLKVTTNQLIGQTLLVPVMTELRQAYPRLKVELLASDTLLDLAGNEIDIALRIGALGSDTGKAVRIALIDGMLVASPRYLDRVGRPKTPDDLARLDFIQYRDEADQYTLELHGEGGPISVPVSTVFAARQPNLVLHAVTSDFGFALAPEFFAAPMLADGTLERVLPAFRPEGKNLYLILQEHSRDSQRVRVFLARLFAELEKRPGLILTKEARSRAWSTAQ